ncbi:hypothetical protein SCFA_330001 [anaerobic digester metagenome]|uniref:Uncharacterized protein n=1 Tax=anaerobic digester metagenome TaxID=1263854 RepID=A0A485M3G1_9ZZZZ
MLEAIQKVLLFRVFQGIGFVLVPNARNSKREDLYVRGQIAYLQGLWKGFYFFSA